MNHQIWILLSMAFGLHFLAYASYLIKDWIDKRRQSRQQPFPKYQDLMISPNMSSCFPESTYLRFLEQGTGLATADEALRSPIRIMELTIMIPPEGVDVHTARIYRTSKGQFITKELSYRIHRLRSQRDVDYMFIGPTFYIVTKYK